MTKSKELEAQIPSEKAIIRRYSDAIAKSPKDIKRGQLALADRHGVAYGGPRLARMISAWKIGIYGALIGGGVLAAVNGVRRNQRNLCG